MAKAPKIPQGPFGKSDFDRMLAEEAEENPSLETRARAALLAFGQGSEPKKEESPIEAADHLDALPNSLASGDGPPVGTHETPHPPERKTPFSPTDFVMFLVGALIAEPLCHAGWDAIVSDEHVDRGVVAIVVGLILGIGAGSFHWWKDRIGENGRAWVQRYAAWWLPIAFIIFFVYVAGPNIYRKAIAPIVQPPDGSNTLSLQSQITTLQSELATARQELAQARQANPSEASVPALSSQAPPPASPISQQPARAYSQAEKEDLRNAMRELSKILNGQGADVAQKINDVLGAWDKVSQPGNTVVLEKRMDDLIASISILRGSLNDQDGALKEYRSYSQEINSVLNLPSQWQSNPVESLWVSVNRFKQNISIVDEVAKYNDRHLLLSILGLDLGVPNLQNAQAQFLNWMAQTKQRIDNFRTSSL